MLLPSVTFALDQTRTIPPVPCKLGKFNPTNKTKLKKQSTPQTCSGFKYIKLDVRYLKLRIKQTDQMTMNRPKHLSLTFQILQNHA